MERVFIDTDISLDMLAERNPFYAHAAILFSKADRKEISLCVSSLTFANLNYILAKQYSTQQARKILSKFKILVSTLAVDDKIIELALSSDFRDFEDAIQYHTCIQNSITTLLTRNTRDYKKAQIAIMTPEEFLKHN